MDRVHKIIKGCGIKLQAAIVAAVPVFSREAGDSLIMDSLPTPQPFPVGAPGVLLVRRGVRDNTLQSGWANLWEGAGRSRVSTQLHARTATDLAVQPGKSQTHQTATVPLDLPAFHWTAAFCLFQRGLTNVFPLWQSPPCNLEACCSLLIHCWQWELEALPS